MNMKKIVGCATKTIRNLLFVGVTSYIALNGSNADANVIITPTYWTTNGVNAGTNLFIDTPYVVRVELDTTQNPSVMIKNTDWDISMPTSWVNFVDGRLPSPENPSTNTNDFFYNVLMDSIYNFVDNTRDGSASGWLTYNSRLTATSSSGPSNRVGCLGEYDVIFTQIFTNRRLTLQGVMIVDTANNIYSMANGNLTIIDNRFSVSAIPEVPTFIRYKITSILSSGADIILTAQTAPNSTNYFQSTNSLTSQFQNVSNMIVAPGGSNAVSITYTNSGAITNSQMFFRLFVSNSPAQFPPMSVPLEFSIQNTTKKYNRKITKSSRLSPDN